MTDDIHVCRRTDCKYHEKYTQDGCNYINIENSLRRSPVATCEKYTGRLQENPKERVRHRGANRRLDPDRVKKRLTEMGMSKAKLGEEGGWNMSTLYKWTNAQYGIPPADTRRMAKMLDTTTGYLYGEELK